MNLFPGNPTRNPSSPKRKWLRRYWVPLTVILVIALLVPAIILINIHWPYRYRNVKPLLQDVLASQITIQKYHRTYFPHPGFEAEGLTLRRDSAPGLPPVGSADRLFVQGRWQDLLRFRNIVQFIDVDGLHIVIPPVGSHANHKDFPPGSSSDFAGPTTPVGKLILHNATFDILREDGSRFTFPIHKMIIGNIQRGQTVNYQVDMDTPPPTGHILATGTFGPIVPHNLAATPLSGRFTFAPVHLGDITSLSGTLSSSGSFHGTIADIEASGHASTPDFAVTDGRPTPVTNTALFAVNGLNGDIQIHSLDTRTGRTLIHATGSILGSPKGTNLYLTVANGRAQDVLRPFLTHFPPVTGPLWLHSHAYIATPAPHRTFLQRLVMDGAFNIPAQRITDRTTEKQLTAFSQRAQSPNPAKNPGHQPTIPDPTGEKAPTTVTELSTPSQDPNADVLCGLSGPAQIHNGIVSTRRLTFEVPGASVNLTGTFNLQTQQVHLLGDLHMESGASHAATGFKSFLLIPLNPFFKRHNAGAVVPIAITGAPNHYKVTQNIFHGK